MSLLLVIQSYTKANDAVQRHWPYYLNAGADEIHGIGTTNGNCIWPEGIKQFKIGVEGYAGGDRLPRRLLDTIDHCLSTDFTHFCIIEHDAIFLKKIPPWDGIAGKLAGYRQPNTSASSYFVHCPWFLDRESAQKMAELGRPMLNEIAINSVEEHTDSFFAWICERHGIPINFNLMNQYTQNTIEAPWQLDEARQAVKDGVEVIHGIKNKQQLDYIFT